MAGKTTIPEVRLFPAFKSLFEEKYRYAIYYGGRGSGKSWNIVRYILVRMLKAKIRVLACREIMQSLEESVHHLMSSQIDMLGLSKFFTVTNKSIICNLTGSDVVFAGLFRNVNKIKSTEGIDIAFIEEGESCSEESLQVLFPTVRKPNSKIIICFNTKYSDDAVYQRFVANSTPGAIVKFVSWKDNPDFPEVLKKEKDTDFAFRPLEAKNIWDGEVLNQGRKVWSEFNEAIHIRDFDMKMIANTSNCFMGCDPAQKYFPACLFMAIFPKNARRRYPEDFVKYVYAEWPTLDTVGAPFHEVRKKVLYTGTLKEMAEQIYIAEGLNTYGIKILKRGIDSRFAKGTGGTNMFSNQSMGMVSEFAKKENGGLIFNLPNEKTIDIQRSKIIADMQYNTLVPTSAVNEPSLFISARCKNLITSMKNHRLEENSEKESEKYKDFSDSLRILYATIADFEYQDPHLMVMEGRNQYSDPQYQNISTSDEQSWMGS